MSVALAARQSCAFQVFPSGPRCPCFFKRPSIEFTALSVFYAALAHGDGAKANSLMAREKRAAPAYQPDAIEAFYGHMAEPLVLSSVSPAGSGDYEVHYQYRKRTALCNGHAKVSVQQSDGHALIAKIRADRQLLKRARFL